MAVDHALALERERGEAVLRIYRWSRPTLSFGRNQPAIDRYDPFALQALGVDVVRRPTGGREVLHDRELTYAAILPLDGPGSLREAYHRINGALLAALRSLGVEARPADDDTPVLRPDAGACFRAPAPGELAVSGRKLVGSAQRRVGRSLLQHGSLLMGPATVGLDSLRLPGVEGDPGQGISLAELDGAELGFDRVARAVEAALAAEYGGAWIRDELVDREREVAETLAMQYESPDWTWRRSAPPGSVHPSTEE